MEEELNAMDQNILPEPASQQQSEDHTTLAHTDADVEDKYLEMKKEIFTVSILKNYSSNIIFIYKVLNPYVFIYLFTRSSGIERS